jgi:DNA-binding NtrC family response regulator
VEKELLLRALKKFDWNQSQAAKYLDLSRKTLIYRMEKYGLARDDRTTANHFSAGGGTTTIPCR